MSEGCQHVLAGGPKIPAPADEGSVPSLDERWCGQEHTEILGLRGGLVGSSLGLILLVPDPYWPWLEQAGMTLTQGSHRVIEVAGSDHGSIPLSSSP